MSIKLCAVVQDLRLPATQKLMLIALADQANDDGENVMPSAAKLGTITGLSPRQVTVALAALRKRGHLRHGGVPGGHLLAGALDRYRVVPITTLGPML